MTDKKPKNQVDLTAAQGDSAIFLPAISTFYSTFIGLQRVKNYVEPNRIPFAEGMEALNFFNKDKAIFPYRWALYSAGHAVLDVNKDAPKEAMIRERDRANTFLLGDSGGFQIGKGVWEGDWKDPNCPKAQEKRDLVLKWMDAYMDYGMVLDIPAWVRNSPNGSKKTGITTYKEAVDGTRINNDYFMANRTGECKFLNVLQGENHAEAHDWYQQMKGYCDPSLYPDNHFNGWAMGGQNMCDIHLILLRLVDLHFDGLLQEGVHDWMHFLGTSKLEWAIVLTDIQKAVRKHYNPKFTISFDCASPFLATANGQIYTDVNTDNDTKWSYHMQPSVDDKKYAIDNRNFRDAVLADGLFEKMDLSPVMTEVKISDVCHYKPGDLNKNGKEGRTSWDSFSYAIQMGHNVWHHINSVQTANKDYDGGKGSIPKMLNYIDMSDGNSVSLAEVVEIIFSCPNREDAKAVIDYYDKFWMKIIGTRGMKGNKTKNVGSTLDGWDRDEDGVIQYQPNCAVDEKALADEQAAEEAMIDARKERKKITVQDDHLNKFFGS